MNLKSKVISGKSSFYLFNPIVMQSNTTRGRQKVKGIIIGRNNYFVEYSLTITPNLSIF